MMYGKLTKPAAEVVVTLSASEAREIVRMLFEVVPVKYLDGPTVVLCDLMNTLRNTLAQ